MDAHTIDERRLRQGMPAAARPLSAITARFSRRSRRRLFRRLFHRDEVTTFHRCLAVHMYYATRLHH